MKKAKKSSIFDEFDEFDLALGLYHFLQHNWNGQTDPLYEAYCKLTAPGMFKAGMSDEYFERIDETAKMVYEMLTEDNYKQALDRVLNYVSSDERE